MSTKYIASNWRLPNQENSSKSDNYGLTFDGSELIDVNYTPPSDWFNNGFSISAWVYPTSPNNDTIIGAYSGGRFYWRLYDTNKWWVGFGSWNDATTVNSVTSDEWQHIVLTYTPSDTTIRFYRNGISDGSIVRNLAGSSMPNIAYPLNIGVTNQSSNSGYFNGSISQCCLYDYTLSESQISTLYGSSSLGAGNPMALKPQPVAFWNLADNSTSNPLTQPNEAVEDASVFEFIPEDYIDCGTALGNQLGNSYTGDITVSMWFNADTVTSDEGLFAIKTGSSFGNITFLIAGSTARMYYNNDGTFISGSISTNQWYNLVGVLKAGDASNTKLYLNGSAVATATTTPSSSLNFSGMETWIGNYYAGNNGFDGEISNVAIWNSDQTTEISNIYNSGVPATTYTNTPTAWYKLDQSANWEADSSGNWQIPDAVSAYPQSFDFGEANAGGQYIDAPTDIGGFTKCSTSVWLNPSSVSAKSTIFATNTGNNFNTYFWSGNVIYVTVDNAFGKLAAVNNYIDANKWNHLSIVYDGTFTDSDAATQNAGRLKMYVNGSYIAFTTMSGTIPSSIPVSGSDNIRIGTYTPTTYEFGGELSNFTIYDTNLSSSQVETLYNNGSPLTTAIATDNLKLWAKLDNTATFSTNWSVPDASGNGNTGTSSGMTEQNLVNNNVSVLNGTSSGMTSANLVLSDLTKAVPYDSYSFNFDSASSDYIDLTQIDLGTVCTISMWLKKESGLLSATILGEPTNTFKNVYYVDWNANTLYFKDPSNNFVTWNTLSSVNNTDWHHYVVTRNGGNTVLYLDGVSQGAGTVGSALTGNTKFRYLGVNYPTNTQFFNGKISNLSIFNQELTSTEVMKLYANGVPQDLSSFSPAPVSWWTLGSNSFFNGSNYICRDLIGSSDGTSANAGVDAVVGDSPRSSANGTGTNMDVPTNLEGSTKWSSNNSWSINMSETARVEDTP